MLLLLGAADPPSALLCLCSFYQDVPAPLGPLQRQHRALRWAQRSKL